MPAPADCATLQALFETVDHARAEAESAWGAERLPFLVPDDLRLKLRRQQARWSTALQDAWDTDALTRDQLAAVENAAGGMKRAWPALAAAATEAGHRPLHGEILGERILPDGTVVAFVRDNDAAANVTASGRAVAVYTLDEVASVIGTLLPESLQLAKVHFPGAKVLEPRQAVDRSWGKQGDELPDFTHGAAA